MKALTGAGHSPTEEMLALRGLDTTLARSPVADEGDEVLDVRRIYDRHGDFVWLTLQRFGVAEGDLDDMTQEVFVVVHRRLGSYDPRARITTWLYGICLRVASGYRRRTRNRREDSLEQVPETSDVARSLAEPGAEEALCAREAQRTLSAILDTLDLEKRAVFVMFEIDELSCDEIAGIAGVPVGTVYSRLHAARAAFKAALARHQARKARGER